MAKYMGEGAIWTPAGSMMTIVATIDSPEASISHSGDVKYTMRGGRRAAASMAEEMWDMEITFKPYGASVAASIAAAKLPDIFSVVYLWGWPIIAVGSLADAINDSISPGSAITIEPPWIYYGGGRINSPTDAEWTATIPLQRTIGITSTVAAVQVS